MRLRYQNTAVCGLLLIVTMLLVGVGAGAWETANLHGVDIQYRRAGSGPALVILPGAAGMDVALYQEVLNALQGQAEVFYVNPRGAGGSGTPADGDYSIEAVVADLEELRKFWQLSNLVVLGHGYGGQVALLYALEFPDAVRGLILSGGAHYLGEDWFVERQEATERHPAFEAYEELPVLEHNSNDAVLMLDFYDWEAHQDRFAWLEPHLQVRLEANGHFMEQDMIDFDLRSRVAAIEQPVLLLWGRFDVVDPVERAEQLDSLLPHSELVVFEEAAHLAFLEQSTAFVEAVEQFLDKL